MIPVCGRTSYLREALSSVTSQGIEPDQMQICIVDNSSPHIDWEQWLSPTEAARVEIIRQPKQLPVAANWDTCVAHARGDLIHILHDDDYVLLGFYEQVDRLARRHPTAGLIASRAFYVDGERHITGVTPLLPSFSTPCHDAGVFLFECVLLCPAIVVSRSAYAAVGGFAPDFSFNVDIEMWSRVIRLVGGVVTPEVLACYRSYPSNGSIAARRSTKSIEDYERYIDRVTAWDPQLPKAKARRRLVELAEAAEQQYAATGDAEAARAYRGFWRSRATASDRLRRMGWDTVRCVNRVLRRLGVLT